VFKEKWLFWGIRQRVPGDTLCVFCGKSVAYWDYDSIEGIFWSIKYGVYFSKFVIFLKIQTFICKIWVKIFLSCFILTRFSGRTWFRIQFFHQEGPASGPKFLLIQSGGFNHHPRVGSYLPITAVGLGKGKRGDYVATRLSLYPGKVAYPGGKVRPRWLRGSRGFWPFGCRVLIFWGGLPPGKKGVKKLLRAGVFINPRGHLCVFISGDKGELRGGGKKTQPCGLFPTKVVCCLFLERKMDKNTGCVVGKGNIIIWWAGLGI